MNKQVVKRLYELLNERKLDRLSEIVDPAYMGPTGEKGVDGLMASVSPVIGAFPDVRWSVDDIVAEDDAVVVRWSWVGTNKNAFRGIPPTGKRMTTHAMAWYHVGHGKIVRAWMESDRLGFLQQLGVVPANLPFGGAQAPPAKPAER
ncbi:MAG TPA: ester cyclase [Dinghuibacter sp.]|uniref:ester cyclase n=1 Tax=Dinghuibacter sp. TaxID=2024697 RepID=UPI002CE03F5C|nr:ester cyclase [Dinghuibacter sp.]HTJ10547.1 ester cyclase [Dinghuibacter sp.]